MSSYGKEKARRFLSEFRGLRVVRHICESEVGEDRSRFLVVMDRPATCSASVDTPVVCLQRLPSSYGERCSLRFLLRRTGDLRKVIARLERSGIGTTVKEIADTSLREELTSWQKAIVTMAVTIGYFAFPRKVSLTALSRIVGVKPSTLSEVMRSAERKIMEGVTKKPAQLLVRGGPFTLAEEEFLAQTQSTETLGAASLVREAQSGHGS